ncbi:AI-2E family transporter [Thalassorhabdomicrobium marinisediminis]|uniref:AI-2E family transporter n=1 Tax=Thalassorhabdomicrobium marinisediminis TaxID=2170577 RepID=A0A2T7FWK0_9RHOB|nr:AI-2E family transporter [Thalassorhabdomicrobium marinisediminis]PVA06545.1 AI-2E family transporter [Thalassorhabdomicrobium marinisediminis]
MALPSQKQFQYWGIAAVVFGLLLWALGDVLVPFILGGAIAYLLDPIADRLERWGMGRVMATVTITITSILLFFLIFLLVLPTLIGQLGDLLRQIGMLVENLPAMWDELKVFLSERIPSLDLQGDFVQEQLVTLGEAIQARSGTLVAALLNSAQGILNVVILLVIVPVVAFYLLMDWDRMVAEIDNLLPLDHRATVRRLARDIDHTLASFLRGQGTVCLILGTYYAIALMVAGLNFGLIIGFIAGLISFIPYVGALVGGVLAIGMALIQWWGGSEVVNGETVEVATNWLRIGIVGAIFAFGQFFEGNILTPKMVGNSVGLHPVWLILALSVFGSLFGFVGMLVAVPVAAVIGVLMRFVIAEYKRGQLYKGHVGQQAEHGGRKDL